MTKISALSDIGTSVASNDTFVLVDASDPTTPNKKIQHQNFFLIPDGSAATPGLRFLNDTDTGIYRSGSNTLDLVTGGSTRLYINSSGNVGIGTTSPDQLLHVEGGDVLIRKTSGYASLYFNSVGVNTVRAGAIKKNYDSPYDLRIQGGNNASAAPICFDRADGSENARFDDSGRFLVGTSSEILAGAEKVLQLRYSNDGPEVVLGRNDPSVITGNIAGAIRFASNGGGAVFEECASIEAQADDTHATGDKPGRLVFSVTADGASSPTEALRITNDRYVRLASGSGGIQFNGDTAAANALDDYEEGTWTPVYTPTSGSFTTMTMNVLDARYTKIGNLVTAEAYIVTSDVDVTGASGSVNVTGLPFTSYSAQPLRRSGAIGYSAAFTAFPVSWAIQENTTTINLYEARGDALDVADLSTGAGSRNIIWLAVSYIAA